MALDRPGFHNILVQDMDAPPDAATELTEVVDEGIKSSTDDLATKQDLDSGLERLRLELLAEIQSRFNSHLRWIMVM